MRKPFLALFLSFSVSSLAAMCPPSPTWRGVEVGNASLGVGAEWNCTWGRVVAGHSITPLPPSVYVGAGGYSNTAPYKLGIVGGLSTTPTRHPLAPTPFYRLTLAGEWPDKGVGVEMGYSPQHPHLSLMFKTTY
jgi:hypothetical protein